MPSNKEREWILITGSSSGLGAELARTYAFNEYNIILHGRNFDKLVKLMTEINRAGVSCEYVLGDLRSKDCLSRLVSVARSKNIKYLINNAAILCQGKPLIDLEQSYIDDALYVNLGVPIYLVKNLCRELVHVININSIAGYERKSNRTIYCATKSALRAFSETLSLETEIKILDVYISKLRKDQSDFGLEMGIVASQIFDAFMSTERSLILDGRIDGKQPAYSN